MLARSVLEQIAGRQHLDWETIQFLEDNLWEHDYHADIAAVEPDDSGIGVDAVDPDTFSEDIFWQDRFDATAEFAANEAQLRAGELNY